MDAFIPNIGDVIRDRRHPEEKHDTYRVTGYTRAVKPTNKWFAGFTDKDGFAHQFCQKADATHICGVSVSGGLIKLEDCEFVRIVDWSAKQIEADKKSWESSPLIGEWVF